MLREHLHVLRHPLKAVCAPQGSQSCCVWIPEHVGWMALSRDEGDLIVIKEPEREMSFLPPAFSSF